MNRRFVAAFSVACIVAAIGAAGSVAYRVLAAKAAGTRAAQADFEGLRSVLAYVANASDLADASLRARLASRYEANPSLLLVDVYERGTGDRWRIPADSPYLPPRGTEGAAPQGAASPYSTILLSSPLKGDSTGRLAVDALYTTLTQASVFESFRDALIGLAAFLALAALTMAIITGSDAPAAESRSPAAAKEPTPASELAAAAAEYQFETLSADEEEPSDDAARDPSATGISIKDDPEPRVREDFDIPVIEEIPPTGGIGAHPRQAGPAGLYSPNSGLGWETYLRERLDAELSRSASFEQDLSLLELRYDALTAQDVNYPRIGKTIESFFSFRDLCFERGDDGFAIVLPNIDSSHALRMAQEFYKKLVFLAEGDFAELALRPLFMGLSSRGGRLVDAERLTFEADSALEKARYEKDSRIVAFKPDPDKYRLYLSSKSA